MSYNLNGKSVFLTGGTGFLGTHLRHKLRDREIDVTLLTTDVADINSFDNETAIEGDLTKDISIPHYHDVLIHLAAKTSIDASLSCPERTWDVNATGTFNILEGFRRHNPDRILVTSTASVYGAPKYLPIDENHPLEPREPYGASKTAADRLTASYTYAYDLPALIARPFNVFGPGQPRHNVVGEIIEQASEGGLVELGNLAPKRDFSYVENIVDGLIHVLERGSIGESYNIGSGSSISIQRLAEIIASEFHHDIEISSTDDKQRKSSVEILDHQADISKLESIAWEPKYSLETGLQKTIEDW